MHLHDLLVLGAGPAGLTAALMAVRKGFSATVLEASDHVGGISRTELHHGYRYDIGGHRFYTKSAEVEALWKEIMGNDFLRVKRSSRIFFGGRFYQYPLRIFETLGNLGPVESFAIMASYVKWKVSPHPEEESFEHWVTNRFGRRLFRTFFKTYTEKVWGIPCTAIRADWAAQRIKGLSLRSAVMNSLFRRGGVKSLIEAFDYPRLGPGMMWEKFAEAIGQAGGSVILNRRATRIHHDGRRVLSVSHEDADGREGITHPEQVISSIPLSSLVRQMDPPAPEEVLAAARGLKYRDFILVGIVVDQPDIFPDNWIYVHSPEVSVGRIQNFGNWSMEMVADHSFSSLGMEYFCSVGDGIWNLDDSELIDLATREFHKLALAPGAKVRHGVVIRQPKAYPVYDADYKDQVRTIRDWLDGFENLETIGRNGQHRYNNQDHSMLTGIIAARNLQDPSNQADLWEVNTDSEYHEEQAVKPRESKMAGAA